MVSPSSESHQQVVAVGQPLTTQPQGTVVVNHTSKTYHRFLLLLYDANYDSTSDDKSFSPNKGKQTANYDYGVTQATLKLLTSFLNQYQVQLNIVPG